MLIGRSLFEDKYESRNIIILRACSAAALIFVLLVLGLFGICVQPLHEAGLLPVREYRTDNELTDNPGIEAPQRSIIVVSYIDNLPGGII